MSKLSYKPKEGITSGPYSPAIESGELIFISGQGTYDPSTGKKYLGDISKQTQLAMENLKRVIESAELSMENIIKVTLFLTELGSLSLVEKIYKQYFQNSLSPVCTTVIVPYLPGGMGIEIEAIVEKA